MGGRWRVYLIVLLAPLAQSSVLFGNLAWRGVKPDLILISLVYLSLRTEPAEALGLGVVLGFIQDSLSGGVFGLNILSKALISYSISNLGGKVVLFSPLSQSFLVVAATLLEGVLFLSVLSLFKIIDSAGGTFLHLILPQTVYNGFASLLLFAFVSRLERRAKRKTPAYKFS